MHLETMIILQRELSRIQESADREERHVIGNMMLERLEQLILAQRNMVRVILDAEQGTGRRIYMAFYGDFIDLAKSNAGFGPTQSAAVLDLVTKEPR